MKMDVIGVLVLVGVLPSPDVLKIGKGALTDCVQFVLREPYGVTSGSSVLTNHSHVLIEDAEVCTVFRIPRNLIFFFLRCVNNDCFILQLQLSCQSEEDLKIKKTVLLHLQEDQDLSFVPSKTLASKIGRVD